MLEGYWLAADLHWKEYYLEEAVGILLAEEDVTDRQDLDRQLFSKFPLNGFEPGLASLDLAPRKLP